MPACLDSGSCVHYIMSKPFPAFYWWRVNQQLRLCLELKLEAKSISAAGKPYKTCS